MQSRASRSRYR